MNTMVLEIKRKKGENTRSLVSRFSRAIRKSGVLVEAKKKRYFKRPLSELKKKRTALRRERLKEKYDKMRKMGKLEKV